MCFGAGWSYILQDTGPPGPEFDTCFSPKQRFEVKQILMMDLFLTNMQLFTLQDVNRWTGVVWIIVMFYQLFGLSFWRHPFSAEDPLVSKWYNAKFLKICSEEETNSSSACSLRVNKSSANFNIWANYSFKEIFLRPLEYLLSYRYI